MDRLFESVWRGGDLRQELWPRSRFDEQTLLRPNMDIRETPESFQISLEVPGVKEEDIELTLEGSTLSIKGKKSSGYSEDKESFHRMERVFGSFQITLSLPENADPNNIQAKFERGILQIIIGKQEVESDQVKKIEIKKT